MKKSNLRLMCISGIFAALVFVVTAYLHIPTYNGYVHVGDGFIFLAACILPMPYAVAVGAIGALLADVLTGYAVWAPGSIIIKDLTAMLFSYKAKKIISARNTFMLIPATAICVGGYYLYEVLIYGSFVGALAGIPGSLIQSVASSIVFIFAGFAMDKTNFRKKIFRGNNL